jgi:hypothetical protein
MRFYRVSYTQDGGNSGGYSWHTSRTQAERASRDAFKEDPKEYTYGPEKIPPKVEPIDVRPTKEGILDALCHYASHPNNG